MAGGDTARRAAAEEMVADLQDALTNAIDAAAEEVRNAELCGQPGVYAPGLAIVW